MTKEPEKKKGWGWGRKTLVGFGVCSLLGGIVSFADQDTSSSGSGMRAIMALSTCETIVKRNLKNPPSYKQVDSELYTNAVKVTYRATNSFGATVTETAICEVDGDLVTLRS